MTWQWVVLILGLAFIMLFAFIVVLEDRQKKRNGR